MHYSIIVPVYNRPDEVQELLASLTEQHVKNFEVVIVEDGSTKTPEDIVASFQDQLDVRYYYQENTGPGPARNAGFQHANGDYFIILDSDCIIPSGYLEHVDRYLSRTYLDAFGGPDRAHDSFTPIQKAINCAMTSTFTTGGIRGRKRHIGTFHPRSFNMGISKDVYEVTQRVFDHEVWRRY